MQKIQGLHIGPKQVAGYVFLPGVVPWVKGFFGSGFGWIAHLMALIYFTARLLPPGHPYLNSANTGLFGIRHVVAEAANNLVIKKENIDQILIFVVLLAAFALLLVQFVFLIFMVFIAPAFAAIGPAPTMFETEFPTDDIAFMLLDQVFAIPKMFGSKFDPDLVGMTPFHNGLHSLFYFYSLALLVIGVFIFLYYIMVTVAETAQSGTPFGKRFASVWAPLRLVVALGLLVPISGPDSTGLNSAQYITLYAAKLGSGFATNGWINFNNVLTGNAGNVFGGDSFSKKATSQAESMIAKVRAPQIQSLIQFMTIAKTCAVLYERSTQGLDPDREIKIEPYIVKLPLDSLPLPPGRDAALTFYKNSDIMIRFGHDGKGAGPHKYPREKGGVKPYCGDVLVHTTMVKDSSGFELKGTSSIQEFYYNLITQMWNDGDLVIFAEESFNRWFGADTDKPDEAWKFDRIQDYQTLVDQAADKAYNITLANDFKGAVPDELLKRGWGGAAIWYNHIAEWNGALFDAVRHAPKAIAMPHVMEEVAKQRRKSVENATAEERYSPELKNGKTELEGNELTIAKALNEVYVFWQVKDTTVSSSEKKSGNIFFDVIGTVFGINGLFSMRQNDPVHPLAQLTAVGKNIIDNAVMYLMASMAVSFIGGMADMMGSYGPAVHSMSSIFVSLTSIGLSVGFLLYYILPFLPFMYFFFAVGSWVKTIFEAMVGVPLWALAHLRIDGNGLPGESAQNGYFLIFEIFLRPILTVFGLLAGMMVFTAMVRTLNGVFDLVTLNMTGFDGRSGTGSPVDLGLISYRRGDIDQFFFTIMYAVIVYMMATASFKMINLIPESILRWMGAGVKSFGDQRDDPTQGMVQMAAFGGATMSREAVNTMVDGSKLGGQGLGALLRNRNGEELKVAGNTGSSGGSGGGPKVVK